MASLTNVKELCKEEFVQGDYQIGYKNIDNIIEGVGKGSVITIGGRPGVGKTTFGHNIILNMIENHNLSVLYVGLESGKKRILESFLGLISKQTPSEIRNNEKVLKEAKETLIKKYNNLYITDDCFTISDLEELLNKNKNIECVFVDYIQLMEIDTEYGSKNKTNEIANRLKRIAKEHNIIIFLLAQLSRNLEHRENKRPLLVDLRDSGNLESNSDIVIFLYKDCYYEMEKGDETSAIEVIIAKNRNGQVGTAFLVFDKNKRIFTNLEYQ